MKALSNNVVRGAVAVAVLVVLVFIVMGWWREYRAANEGAVPAEAVNESVESTPTDGAGGEEPEGGSGEAEPSDTEAPPPAAEPDNTVIVLIDGLNFRAAPDSTARAIRGLDKGEKLRLLGTQDGWHEVEDDDGTTGWVSSNPNYTETERR